MIILIIHINRVRPIKLECYSPISAYPNRPHATAPACKFVQVQAGKIHILWGYRSVKSRQYEPQSRGVCRLDPGLATAQKEAFQSLVFEASDHERECNA